MNAEMRDFHSAHIHIMAHIWHLLMALVKGELIAPKIHINPAAFFAVPEGTAKDVRIKFDSCFEVACGNGKM